jgi:hypothetical protein
MGGGEDRLDAAHEADGRIGRRARDLGHPHGSRRAVDAHDIGEGTAGINADPQLDASARHVATPRRSMIPKSGYRFSEKIMLKQ